MPEAEVGRWPDDTDTGQALENDLGRDLAEDSGDGAQDTSSESPVEEESPAAAPAAQQPDLYQARFDALEQRHRELEATLQRFINEQQTPAEAAPPFMTRPASAWTPEDLADIGRHAAKTEIERFAQEQEW